MGSTGPRLLGTWHGEQSVLTVLPRRLPCQRLFLVLPVDSHTGVAISPASTSPPAASLCHVVFELLASVTIMAVCKSLPSSDVTERFQWKEQTYKQAYFGGFGTILCKLVSQSVSLFKWYQRSCLSGSLNIIDFLHVVHPAPFDPNCDVWVQSYDKLRVPLFSSSNEFYVHCWDNSSGRETF